MNKASWLRDRLDAFLSNDSGWSVAAVLITLIAERTINNYTTASTVSAKDQMLVDRLSTLETQIEELQNRASKRAVEQTFNRR